MTGIGKTTFLLGLERRGAAVIDLEGLACHRGSAFGALGLCQLLTQKRFETLLWDRLRHIPPGTPVIVEGESKRIGKISLPGNMYDVMQKSVKIWAEASLETRVARLTAEYGLPAYREEMAAALERIRKKLGGDRYAELSGCLERWEMAPFMTGLIQGYYDKVYYKTREWEPDLKLSLEEFPAAEETMVAFLYERFGRNRVPGDTA
jgi:tRNA 2-selenouridine synthase